MLHTLLQSRSLLRCSFFFYFQCTIYATILGIIAPKSEVPTRFGLRDAREAIAIDKTKSIKISLWGVEFNSVLRHMQRPFIRARKFLDDKYVPRFSDIPNIRGLEKNMNEVQV